MKRSVSVGFVLLVLCVSAVLAIPMELQVVMGKALVWSPQNAGWTAVSDSCELGFGDSLFVDNGDEAHIAVGQSILLKMKGMGRLALIGSDLDLTVALVDGQLFLRREKPYEMNMFMVDARGCQFIPIGTAGAIKFTKMGEPTIAMLKGQMRMQGPTGDAVLVNAGQFATFDLVGNSFKQGELRPNAVAALEEWAGEKLESAAQVVDATAEPAADETAAVEPDAAMAPAAAPEGPQMAEPVATAQNAEPEAPVEAAVEAPVDPASDAAPVAEPEKPAKKEQKERKSSSGGGMAKGAAVSSDSKDEGGSEEAKVGAESDDKGDKGEGDGEKGAGGGEKPTWGISAGPVTVGDEQWTRIAFFGDIPIWKFGLGIDVELFMNADGEFDKKGWDFKEDWVEALSRKLVYIRFQHENDPVFAKFGGLDDVTLGYGFVMDRFSNMLHYPDEKLLGLQFYLNDISPIGVTLQTVVADFKDFRDDGGIVGGRFGLKPFKATEKPVIGGLQIAATYVQDIDQYASGRRWQNTLDVGAFDSDRDNKGDYAYFSNPSHHLMDNAADTAYVDSKIAAGAIDTHYVNPEIEQADTSKNGFGVFGLDATVPIISSKVVNLDIYGQFAMSMDDDDPGDASDSIKAQGWGIGAPGVALSVGPLWARVEYRHTVGRFTPGYFGPYYLDERIYRYPVSIKESRLVKDELNGVYGNLGFNISNVLIISGQYQYLIPKTSGFDPDHRFELSANVGSMIVEKIPKINKVEGFLYKTNIGAYNESFFEKSPAMYWGYRLGFEIMQGAGIIWEARYGWVEDQNGNLKKNDNIGIQASLTF